MLVKTILASTAVLIAATNVRADILGDVIEGAVSVFDKVTSKGDDITSEAVSAFNELTSRGGSVVSEAKSDIESARSSMSNARLNSESGASSGSAHSSATSHSGNGSNDDDTSDASSVRSPMGLIGSGLAVAAVAASTRFF
ncbi:hypothetical protein EV182_003055 [Spiromyces aspiralis]|uniref:Uncharacterized protein n=1 Tax=Spiromyces aspiralis TaxID=68401 RepID=A0ACC1HX30_9FUNG|nr:hypothetical protein EV182_003055 [Spiromyces aspiralis]